MKKILVFVVLAIIICGCQKSSPEKKTKTEVKEDIVSFVAVGDNLMHQRLLDEAKTENGYDFSPYYTNIKPYIEKADIAFVNQ